jgi:hypothetical protein
MAGFTPLITSTCNWIEGRLDNAPIKRRVPIGRAARCRAAPSRCVSDREGFRARRLALPQVKKAPAETGAEFKEYTPRMALGASASLLRSRRRAAADQRSLSEREAEGRGAARDRAGARSARGASHQPAGRGMTFCGMRACGRLAMSAVAPTETDLPGLVRVQPCDGRIRRRNVHTRASR